MVELSVAEFSQTIAQDGRAAPVVWSGRGSNTMRATKKKNS